MQESRNKNTESDQQQAVLVEKVIQISRITKVVSGGKRMAFRAFVIVGDGAGNVGIGLGKSKEVPAAIRKAVDHAKKSMVSLNLVEGTLPHETNGRFGASKVVLKPARPGTGVIAGGSIRILLEVAGFKNIVAKALGSNNAINSAKAGLDGLLKCKNYEEESKLRGKSLPVRQPVKG